LLAHPKPEPCSNRSFCGEERLEDLLHRGRFHAMPRVGDGYPDASSPIVRMKISRGTQDDPAVRANCMQTVHKQIREHLAQLAEDSNHLWLSIASMVNGGSAGLDLRLEESNDRGH
jgi:hypothetical protein